MEAPNDVWTADFKGQFRTRDGLACYPLTIVDAHSRFLIRCDGYASPDAAVKASFQSAFIEYGLPRAIRTDNGTPFVGPRSPAGLSTLSVWWVRLGVTPERIMPASPWENGRHERMHRTLKAEATQPPQSNRRVQQRVFNAFREQYKYVSQCFTSVCGRNRKVELTRIWSRGFHLAVDALLEPLSESGIVDVCAPKDPRSIVGPKSSDTRV